MIVKNLGQIYRKLFQRSSQVICEFTRNNGLRKYIFFINPGKYFLPVWIDEATLLKLRDQRTYRQETQYTIFLTMQL